MPSLGAAGVARGAGCQAGLGCRKAGRWTSLSEVTIVRGLSGWLAAFLAGSAGWWLGAKMGLGAAVVLGAVAGGAGLYAGYRWFDSNLK